MTFIYDINDTVMTNFKPPKNNPFYIVDVYAINSDNKYWTKDTILKLTKQNRN